MSYGIIHLTCLCGRTFDINDESSVSCQCGTVVNGKSLDFIILPVSRNIRLVEYCDTGKHDKDLFGEIINGCHTKPVYRGFTFSCEYGDGRWDECDSYIVATKLSDPHIRFTVFHSRDSYKLLLKQIDIYHEKKDSYSLIFNKERDMVSVLDRDGNEIGNLRDSEELYIMYLYEHPRFGHCVAASVKEQDGQWADKYLVWGENGFKAVSEAR